jgi:hypothetical protein
VNSAGAAVGSGLTIAGSTATTGGTPTAWETALGSGIQVSAPKTVTPGTDSPADAVAGYYDAFLANKPFAVCAYVQPSAQATCKTDAANGQLSDTGGQFLTNPAIGYVVVKGTQALVTLAGTECVAGAPTGGSCQVAPDAAFDESVTFDSLYQRAGNPMLNPCAEVSGKWYLAAAAA